LENQLTLGRPAHTHLDESGNIRNAAGTDGRPVGVTSCGTGANNIPTVSCASRSDRSSAGDSVGNQAVYSESTNIVNARSESLTRSGNLLELTLPTFTDSAKQVPLHFIRDLELYFKLRQTPDHLKLPLAFRAVQEPIAKQWFSSAYDRLTQYDDFKKGFTELLWNPNRQAGIRSRIYLDRHAPESGESYVDHYIRYANLASTLDPPLQDADLLSALTAHYEPRIQQGLLCGNFKCTQEVLGYLSKVQSLQEDRNYSRIPSRENAGEGIIRRPHLGGKREDRPRDRGSHVNVRTMHRQTDRPNTRYGNRRNNTAGEQGFYECRQGIRDGDRDILNPEARPFNAQRLGALTLNGQDKARLMECRR